MQSILDTAETKRNHQLDDNLSTRATREYRDIKLWRNCIRYIIDQRGSFGEWSTTGNLITSLYWEITNAINGKIVMILND